MSDATPIILFTYNRPEHTRRTLESLALNDLASRSELTIYCDGPRAEKDVEATEQVREVVRRTTGFARVTVVERSENLGLAKSLINGIDDALAEHDGVIVMEDDLVTSPHFLRFMNDGLGRYADEDQVVGISGYRFPVTRPMPETFFLPGAFCWGWATWRRGWALYEHDAEALLAGIIQKDLIYEFDFRGTDPMTQILQWTVNRDSRVDSWASRWMGSACLNRKLTLYPGRTLVANIGFDGSGNHSTFGLSNDRFASPMAPERIQVAEVPVVLDDGIVNQHREVFRSWLKGGSLASRAYRRLAPLLPMGLDRAIYTRLVHRRLRKNATEAIAQALGG